MAWAFSSPVEERGREGGMEQARERGWKGRVSSSLEVALRLCCDSRLSERRPGDEMGARRGERTSSFSKSTNLAAAAKPTSLALQRQFETKFLPTPTFFPSFLLSLSLSRSFLLSLMTRVGSPSPSWLSSIKKSRNAFLGFWVG